MTDQMKYLEGQISYLLGRDRYDNDAKGVKPGHPPPREQGWLDAKQRDKR